MLGFGGLGCFHRRSLNEASGVDGAGVSRGPKTAKSAPTTTRPRLHAWCEARGRAPNAQDRRALGQARSFSNNERAVGQLSAIRRGRTSSVRYWRPGAGAGVPTDYFGDASAAAKRRRTTNHRELAKGARAEVLETLGEQGEASLNA
ncbi:ABC1 domain-containing protein [Pycnococcus provasolii]